MRSIGILFIISLRFLATVSCQSNSSIGSSLVSEGATDIYENRKPSLSYLVTNFQYKVDNPFRIPMDESRNVTLELSLNQTTMRDLFGSYLEFQFELNYLTPQIKAVSFRESYSSFCPICKEISVADLKRMNSSTLTINLELHGEYLGLARLILQPRINITSVDNSHYSWHIIELKMFQANQTNLDLIVNRDEGVWGTIFIVSVSILIIASQINIGAQLNLNDLKNQAKRKFVMFFSVQISGLVMMFVTLIVGRVFLTEHPLFRIGSFIFACGPAASASTLWTVMLGADKELSVTLQVLSSIQTLISMPILLHLYKKHYDLGYEIRMPYGKLIQVLSVIVLALYLGVRLISPNERLQKISQRIFKPFTFFVLLYIIVFSSIVYWPIYKMFDWNIVQSSLIVILFTYAISGFLGFLINFDLDQAITISITSVYKHSGVAFAVLLLTFDQPLTYIAYVPCLVQITLTSFMLYFFILIKKLTFIVMRRNQPSPIQATSGEDETEQTSTTKPIQTEAKHGEQDEFIDVNVTDVEPCEDKPTQSSDAGKPDT